MRAVVRDRYGPPDVLRVKEVPKPVPRPGEVLVRVQAASLNSWDWDVLKGNGLGRIDSLFRPKRRILGADIAGVVEATGEGVTRLLVGDAVFGDLSSSHWGGLAEYAVAPEKLLAMKSDRISFIQAAAMPQAGLLALQGLRQKGHVRRGHKVLVNGAGGGMGSFAVQLAAQAGAEVTGVDSAMKLDFIQRLGAEHALDYAQTDFTATGETYDLIVDAVANRPMDHYARALVPNGRFVMVGGTVRALFAVFTRGTVMSRRGAKWLGLVMLDANTTDLNELQELCAKASVVPAIGGRFSLEEVPEAFRLLGAGEALGKLVVTLVD